ncbi:hypothetical protein [Flavobacterium acetivorans]|uniref:hypothetical protein n=1 Tax=Flavobacterium acetivorans TaxID=2893883 RepID=UPI001E494E37|nr:hypothetical protein [Flavobacterium sp. F-29]UFH34651.1 hypothetical protein LNP19_11190 [Flavobacterium sp. F-29]
MKKLLFTALAVVAFSGVAMANTIADEQVVKEKNEKTTILLYDDYWDCAKLANSVYTELIEVFSEEESMQNADAYFDDCMGSSSPCQPPFLC